MESKVLYKVANVSDKGELCFCDKEFSKTCSLRHRENLQCCEVVIRITPVDREGSEITDSDFESLKSLDKELKDLQGGFRKTLNHMGR